jgi:two-component system phosphate regulon sensor histidine kinase PhoR
VTDNQVIGFLNLDSIVPNFFNARYAERLKGFVNQAAIALKNAQMFQKLALYSEDLEQAVADRTAALTKANVELEQLSQTKDEFVANVSHELRTPITNLHLYQTLLRKRPENLDKYLTVIERETHRLEHIIEDLLRLSRLDQERTQVNLLPIDLNQLVKQFIQDRVSLAEQKEITLLFKGKPDLPMVLVDQSLFEQVLSILLTNALNYTPMGGQVNVAMQTQSLEDQTWTGFSISDTGPGISIDEHEKLFDRFYRGLVGQQSKMPGTGLGLALAKEIIDRHNGRIFVDSEGIPGRGASFSVLLPIVEIDTHLGG